MRPSARMRWRRRSTRFPARSRRRLDHNRTRLQLVDLDSNDLSGLSSSSVGERQDPVPRGHYKIFLGMAAGVGKTYRMLQEGQAEAEAGRDVVIGYLEPHGRAETTEQAEGLEVVPRRRVTYRDSVLEEMDLPALLRR